MMIKKTVTSPKILVLFLLMGISLIFGNLQINSAYASSQLFEYYNTNDDTAALIYGNDWKAQTFTATGSVHSITSVKLRMLRYGNPGVLTVSLRATNESGNAVGADLTVGTINANTFTTVVDGEWYEIALTEYVLSVNTKYAIVCCALNGNSSNFVYWRDDMTDPAYDDGCFEGSNDAGQSWTSYTDDDLMFEIWGENQEYVLQNEQVIMDYGNLTSGGDYSGYLTAYHPSSNDSTSAHGSNFYVSNSFNITHITTILNKYHAYGYPDPTVNIMASIYELTEQSYSGLPTGSPIVNSDLICSYTLSSGAYYVNFTFSVRYLLQTGKYYAMVIQTGNTGIIDENSRVYINFDNTTIPAYIISQYNNDQWFADVTGNCVVMRIFGLPEYVDSSVTGSLSWYMRSDTHTVNGVNAYCLNETNSALTTTNTSSRAGEYMVYWGFRVYAQHSSDSAIEITSGQPNAMMWRVNDGSGLQNSTSNIAYQQLEVGFSAIKVEVYTRIGSDSEWQLMATFITTRLSKTGIESSIWTFSIYTNRTYVDGDTYSYFKYGNSDCVSAIYNVQLNDPIPIGTVDLYFPATTKLAFQHLDIPFETKGAIITLTVASGTLNGSDITLTMHPTDGRFTFTSHDDAVITLSSTSNGTTFFVNGELANSASIASGLNYVIEWSFVEPTFLLPILFIVGMVGLGSMFVGPLYAIHKIKRKEYYSGFVFGLIVTFTGVAFVMAWLWR